jgi:NAD(P)-dependent dehydrogenase (short-subunit alcohol dehydrogenase family)
MTKRFTDPPRVVVSGAGSGIGRAIALRFAKQHRARVLALDIDEARAEETAELVTKAGGAGEAMRCDVCDLRQWEAAAHAMRDRFGGVDVVVNNAGVAAAGRIGEMPIEDWRRLLRTNLEGVINGCHVFVPILRAQRSGYVLNVASAGGIASLPLMGAYNVTKAGVIALSETLHAEAGADGVAVTVLCPTFVRTNLLESFSGGARERRLAERFFARALLDADAVAAVAVRALERNVPIVIPQIDGRWVWRLKRLAPIAYLRLLRHYELVAGE